MILEEAQFERLQQGVSRVGRPHTHPGSPRTPAAPSSHMTGLTGVSLGGVVVGRFVRSSGVPQAVSSRSRRGSLDRTVPVPVCVCVNYWWFGAERERGAWSRNLHLFIL